MSHVPELERLAEKPMFKATLTFAALLCGAFAAAQQTGGIEGVVTLRGATTPADIVVVAESDVMPRARTTKIDAEGRYALPQLIPGVYRLMFKMTNGARPHGDHHRAAGPDDGSARRI